MPEDLAYSLDCEDGQREVPWVRSKAAHLPVVVPACGLRKGSGGRLLFFQDREVVYSEIFHIELIDLQLAQVDLLYQEFSYYYAADH